MKITLPYPPSVNHYWRAFRMGKSIRFYVSDEAKKYRRAVGELLSEIDMILGPLNVRIEAYPPDRKKHRDIDNILKGLLDSMEHAGVFENDSQIVDLHVVKRDPAPPGRVEVTVTQAAREWQPELL
jgi:crossover junction endodeoxyribonuclease RusA